jgi:hypothetical protein
MGKTFKNIHACAVGRFPVNGDKIPQWIRAHGGTFSKGVTEDVTHLITTKDTFEKNVEAGINSLLPPRLPILLRVPMEQFKKPSFWKQSRL